MRKADQPHRVGRPRVTFISCWRECGGPQDIGEQASVLGRTRTAPAAVVLANKDLTRRQRTRSS